MHSEVSIRFVEEIQFDWLVSGLPASSDPALVLAKTHFSNSPDVLSSVLYARLETTFAYLLFRDDARSVRIHVEGRESKGDLRHLVQKSEHLADRFVRAGRVHGARDDEVLINLYAGDHLITCGARRSWSERLLQRFADTIFRDVMVGMMTGLLTLLGTQDWTAGVIASVAAIFSFLLWLAIEIRGGRDEYAYEAF
jgi:hypothetical protein